jgi:nucleoside-diphosphate-sugar epimerase
MKNKVLLIGGGGFIGKNLQVIKDDDVMVSVIDSLPPVDGLAKYPLTRMN